jgi:hypothetical protein
MTSTRRFPPPWQVEQTPGVFKVLDASGQALAYVYARETREQADIAKVLTFDEARRIAVNVANLPERTFRIFNHARTRSLYSVEQTGTGHPATATRTLGVGKGAYR